MTRLGGTILALIILAGIGFASMLSLGRAPETPWREAAVPATSLTSGNAALTMPVAGVTRDSLTDTWGDSRAGGQRAHQGIDIAARRGTPVIAAAPGRIEKLFESGDGGLTLYVRSPDASLSYYYAHLAGYAPGIQEGMTVGAGTLLGYVGDTGNAGVGNAHLHFAVNRMRPADGWWEGEPVNPYPLLARRPLDR